MSERQSGTVMWFDPARGYGVIAPEDGSRQVHVHISGVAGDEFLREGQKVWFVLKSEEKRREAAEVTFTAPV